MTETQTNTGISATTGRKLSILVVDDNAINLRLVITLLAKLGHKVDSAKDGADAVEKFTNNAYDAILMDVMMPVMDGITATGEIRKIEGSRNIIPSRRVKIIAITANSDEADRGQYLKAGMDNFIGKPLMFNELKKVLHATVR